MNRAAMGDWVEIAAVVLEPHERAPNLPKDTSRVPYTLKVRGFAATEAGMGEEILITTVTGRQHRGKLEQINPAFRPDYGESIPEIIRARLELKELMRDGQSGLP
jgi:hypothetical protein